MIGVGSFYIAKRERGLDRLAELVGLAGVGSGGFPKFQCSLCHDWFRGEDGSDDSDWSDQFIFSEDSFYIAKRCPYNWVAGSGEGGGLFRRRGGHGAA